MNINEFREKHPEYGDIPDAELADRLHRKHYSDVPKAEFDAKFLGDSASKYIPENKVIGRNVADSALSVGQGLLRMADPLARSAVKAIGPDTYKWLEKNTKGFRTDPFRDTPIVENGKTLMGVAEKELEKRKFNEPSVTFDDVKKDPLLGGRWFVEQGIGSLPQMAAAVANLPTFAASVWGNLSADRAKNQGKPESDLGDMAATLPGAVVSALFERIGAKATFGLDEIPKGFFKQVARGAVREGLTEGSQEIIEFLSTTVDTKHGKLTWAEVLDRGLQGAVLGSMMGGTFRGISGLEKKIAPHVEKGRQKLAKMPPFNRWDPLGTLPESELNYFLDEAAEFKGREHVASKNVEGLLARMENIHDGDMAKIEAYLENPISLKTVPAQHQHFAKRLKQRIEALGKAAAKRGLISEDALRENYLPRMYMEYVTKNFGANAGARINTGPYKSRKDLSEIERRGELTQLDDPRSRITYALLTGRHNVNAADFLKSLRDRFALPEQTIEVPTERGVKRLTSQEARQEADRHRTYYEALKGDDKYVDNADWNLSRANLIDGLLADAPPTLDAKQRKKYKLVPDRKEWGALAGRRIPKEVFGQLTGNRDLFVDPDTARSPGHRFMRGMDSGINVALRPMLSRWKIGKVAMNPPTIARNIMSNTILLNLSGVPLRNVPTRLAEAVRSIRDNDADWRLHRRMGVKSSTIAHSEFKQVDKVAQSLLKKNASSLKKAGLMADAFLNVFGEAYGDIENVYKHAKFLDERRKGKTTEEAAREAQHWLFDYSRVPKGVDWARHSGIAPFITFQWKATPRMLEAAARRPLLMAGWVAATQGAVSQLLASTFLDMGEDDFEKLKASAWKWIAENPGSFLLPWKDDKGQYQFVDLNYIAPFGWMVKGAQEIAEGRAPGSVGEVVSTPVFDLWGVWDAFANGRDAVNPFTNSKLWDRNTPVSEKWKKAFEFTWNTIAPTMFTQYGLVGGPTEGTESKIAQKIAGQRSKYTGEEPYSWEQLAPRAIGLNVAPVNPEETRRVQVQWKRRALSAARSEMRKRLREANRVWRGNPEKLAEERERIRREGRAIIRDRMQELREYRQKSGLR